MDVYNVLGVMSGTSLDGLDICYCTFSLSSSNKWSFKLNYATTVNFELSLKKDLKSAIDFSGIKLSLLNNKLGDFIGQSINTFIQENNLSKKDIHFISSHGHTVFHQPEKKLTLQIGNGANIASITKLPVICDFRTVDLALNGNGAPLVPIGDKHLFSQYDYCLNLGGIANISYYEKNQIAYDICPANMVLNLLSKKLGKEYDKGGKIASSGELNDRLFTELNNLNYYKDLPPKSLGYEWVLSNVIPIISSYNISIEDKLRTYTEHIAFQISSQLKINSSLLVTGGGAFNDFLIERIKDLSNAEVILPKKEIIAFKEALIFGFLGVLRYRNEVNVLKSVTGAKYNNIGGCIYNTSTI